MKNSLTHLSRRGAGRRRGFSLLEMIGVIGIVTILASVVTLNAVDQMKRAARRAEAASMRTMRDALRVHILRTRQIPAPNQWPQAIASELGVSVDRVLQTRLGYARAFVRDPLLQIGPASSLQKDLPFVQGLEGSIEPVNPRLVMVSTLGTNLPAIPNQAAAFDNVWNTAANAVPSGWGAWPASGEDLWIERLDLRGLFHRVVFNNLDPDNIAPYGIDGVVGAGGNLVNIPSGHRVEAWFIENTPITLHFAGGALQAREHLREDVSYVFENGRWSRYTNYGPRPPLSGFGLLAEQFRQCAVSGGEKFGATPQAVIEEVFTYLYTYGVWATGDPAAGVDPFEKGGSNSDTQVPAYQVLLDSQKRLERISENLID